VKKLPLFGMEVVLKRSGRTEKCYINVAARNLDCAINKTVTYAATGKEWPVESVRTVTGHYKLMGKVFI
jgi:hypothetical protein